MNQQEKKIINKAISILSRELKAGAAISSPADARAFAQLSLAAFDREVFGMMVLDTQHQMLAFETLFFGTIDAASVYPREVVKSVLAHNGAAVIFAHNHPSGNHEPSQSDERLTLRLRDALALIDVRVLDHIVVSLTGTTSMAERGLL